MLSGLPVFADLGETVAPVNVNSAVSTAASPLDTVASEAKSAILIEANTRTVLYEKDADMALPPASVTKVMTMLLVMEAIDSGKISPEDTVTVSAYASKMGGSQVYLEEGEQMSVHELLKCVVVASANDACVALAEHIAGSEEAFVSMMNARARELKMEHTNFENTNGLDDDTKNHVISARDIATMSAELIINHPKILEYSSIWMDSIRGGAFGLTNTNRLIRFYNGANGLKTGSTSKAGFCISATAERDGVSLICVIMGAETRDVRNALATRLLDYGFANYGVYKHEPEALDSLAVKCGTKNSVSVRYDAFEITLPKTDISKVKYTVTLPEYVTAPLKKGDAVGEVTFTLDGREIGKSPIYADEEISKISFMELWLRILAKFLLK
jgi:D-alanyl-D-alanine carboxypeptidase (penicillin-binding protein 5/6)